MRNYKKNGEEVLPPKESRPKPPPAPPSVKKENNNHSLTMPYEVYPIQLGMIVQDAASLIQKRLNERYEAGYRYCGKLQVNVSEAVLIFEKRIKY